MNTNQKIIAILNICITPFLIAFSLKRRNFVFYFKIKICYPFLGRGSPFFFSTTLKKFEGYGKIFGFYYGINYGDEGIISNPF